MKGFQLGPQWLVIGKDRYPLARITDVRLRTLRWPQHLQRALLCGLQWSAVGWALAMFLGAMAIYLALLLFTVAFVGALANYRSHEVQARFAAVDESGPHWVTLLRVRGRATLSRAEALTDALGCRCP